MLLKNECKVCHSVHIKLTFDDYSIKEFDIYESDYVRVEYRRNGCKETVTGEIVDIIPYIVSNRMCTFNRKESALIKIDASKEYKAEVVAIDISDIIDITRLIPTHCCCCHCGTKSDENPSEEDTTEPPENEDSSIEEGDEVENGQEEA
jgi:hypothetical protein